MSNEIKSIDQIALECVTGGSKSSSYGTAVLNDISNLASSIKDLTKKTSGFDSTQMLLLCCLAMRNQQQGANVVYVSRSRYW